MRQHPATRILAALVGLSALPALATVEYTVTDLGTLGGPTATPLSINNLGQVVGYSTLPSGVQHAFLYDHGTLTNLGGLTDTGISRAYAINDNGQIAGYAVGTSSRYAHATLFSNGTVTDLGTFGTGEGDAEGINSSGDIVGEAYTAAGKYHAFLYSRGQMTDLGTFGGDWSSATGINDNGQIALLVALASPSYGITRGYLYDANGLIDIGTLGGGSAFPFGINSHGDIVGRSSTADQHAHAFLYSHGTMHDLGILFDSIYSVAWNVNDAGQAVGWDELTNGTYCAVLFRDGAILKVQDLIPPDSGYTLTGAVDINNAGQIIAAATSNATGQSRALLLNPIPEPAAPPVLLLFPTLLAYRRPRRAGPKAG